MILKQEVWPLDASLATRSVFRQFQKKYPREYQSCFNNLDKIQKLLREGKRLSELQYNPSFFRHETDGIFRIGQSGVSGAKESSLYVFLESSERVIYLLSIGTKETQKSDLILAKKAIRKIFK